jgi:hypothetical protein
MSYLPPLPLGPDDELAEEITPAPEAEPSIPLAPLPSLEGQDGQERSDPEGLPDVEVLEGVLHQARLHFPEYAEYLERWDELRQRIVKAVEYYPENGAWQRLTKCRGMLQYGFYQFNAEDPGSIINLVLPPLELSPQQKVAQQYGLHLRKPYNERRSYPFRTTHLAFLVMTGRPILPIEDVEFINPEARFRQAFSNLRKVPASAARIAQLKGKDRRLALRLLKHQERAEEGKRIALPRRAEKAPAPPISYHELFEYSPEQGVLLWKKDVSRSIKESYPAGCLKTAREYNTEIRVGYNKHYYKAVDIIFELMMGQPLPDHLVCHYKDGDRTNLEWDNLEFVTRVEARRKRLEMKQEEDA